MLLYGILSNKYRTRHAAVDVAVFLVLLFFGSGEGWRTGGGGGFDDGVEVEQNRSAAFHLVRDIGEDEGGAAVLSADADHQHTDFCQWRDGVEVHHIVGTGFISIKVWQEDNLDLQAVGVTAGDVDLRQRATGDAQGRIVDVDNSIVVHKLFFVQAREVVGLGHPVGVGLFGKPTLEDGAVKGGGLLPRLEECPLAQLRFGLAVVVLRRQLTRVSTTKTGIVYLPADGTGVLYDGWFYLCHNWMHVVCVCYAQRRNRLFIALLHRSYIEFE